MVGAWVVSWLWLRMRFVVVGCCGGSKVARFGGFRAEDRCGAKGYF